MKKDEIIESLKNKEGKFIFYVNIDPKYNSLADYEMFYQAKVLMENGFNTMVLLDDEVSNKKLLDLKEEKSQLIKAGYTNENSRYLQVNLEIKKLEDPYPTWFDDSLKTVKILKLSQITENFKISSKDFIIMGELFSNVALQLKKLPSKNIIYIHNYNAFVTTQTNDLSYKYDLGINTFLYTNNYTKKFIEDNYAAESTHLKFHKLTPTIPTFFNNAKSYKKLKVGIVSRNGEDVKKLHKIFMKRYPSLNFVSFEVIGGLRRDEYAKKLSEFAVLVEMDKLKTFGTVVLEGIASGCFVVSQLSELQIDYIEDNDTIPITLVNKVVGSKDASGKFNDVVSGVYNSLLMFLQNYNVKSESSDYVAKNPTLFESEDSVKKIVDTYTNIINERIKEIEKIELKEEENEA